MPAMIMKMDNSSSALVSSSTNDDDSNNNHHYNSNASNSSSNGRNSANSNHHRATNVNRMNERALLAKLQDMVPTMPREKKVTKLNIIKNVIDYIRDLGELADSGQTTGEVKNNIKSNNQKHK